MTDAVEALMVGVLDEVLAELKAIKAQLGNTAQQAKVEIKTSTRGADVTVVAYEITSAADLESAGNNAVREYRRVMQQLSAEVMAAFVAEAQKAARG